MAVSELPGNPNAVWTVRRNIDDAVDAYIVVSFVNATLVLTIGETVEEAADSGFLATSPTLGCGLIGEDALLQVSFLNYYKNFPSFRFIPMVFATLDLIAESMNGKHQENDRLSSVQ